MGLSEQIRYSKVTSQPSEEPFDLTEAKLFLRVDGDSEDDLITSLITAARVICENHCESSFVTQSRTLKYDWFPACEFISLPYGPVSSVTSISYYDEAESSQTLSSSDYWVDTHSQIARIKVKNSWPATGETPGAVSIVYVCGYGAASAVPEPIKAAIKLVLGHLYEHREENNVVNLYEIPLGVQAILSPYVITQNAFY